MGTAFREPKSLATLERSLYVSSRFLVAKGPIRWTCDTRDVDCDQTRSTSPDHLLVGRFYVRRYLCTRTRSFDGERKLAASSSGHHIRFSKFHTKSGLAKEATDSE